MGETKLMDFSHGFSEDLPHHTCHIVARARFGEEWMVNVEKIRKVWHCKTAEIDCSTKSIHMGNNSMGQLSVDIHAQVSIAWFYCQMPFVFLKQRKWTQFSGGAGEGHDS